jgi:hypothetical protein
MPPTLAPLTPNQIRAFVDAAHATGCSPNVVAAAADVVARRRPLLLGLSGWPGAGKDVIGAAVPAALGVDARHLYFAQPLKDEVNAIIETCRGADPVAAARTIADAQQVALTDAELAVQLIHVEAQNPEVHARTRSTAVRSLLQRWGTDVRRRQDANYWARKALIPAVEAIADGAAAYMSDVRFPNEVTGSQALGFVVVRLDISTATVASRLAERDGLQLDDAAVHDLLAFPSESELNNWPSFDLRFVNENGVAHAVETVTRHLRDVHGLTEPSPAAA